MQEHSNIKLFDALVDALPLAFVTRLVASYPALCAEAEQEAEQNPLIGESEASYVAPHLRRAMFETNLRRIAIEYGLESSVRSNANGSASYAIVKAGPFFLTASYVNSPGKRVRSAVFRSEASVLNDFLDQDDMFGFSKATGEKDQEFSSDTIYGIFLYGGIGSKSFMEIAFPSATSDGYVERYSLIEILEAASIRKSKISDVEKFKVMPKPRRIEKDGTSDEGAPV